MDEQIYQELRREYMGAVWDLFLARRQKDDDIPSLQKMSYINFLLKQAGRVPMKMRVVHDEEQCILCEFLGWFDLSRNDRTNHVR